MSMFVAALIFVVLLTVSIAHFMWAVGSPWPIRDPLLLRTAAVQPTDLVSLQRTVVADTLVRERETVLVRLKRRGILCIDASPGEVGMQLLDRYLEIKRREMI